MKYRFIDKIKSDVMFEAYGKTLKELFQNSAEALFSVICKMDKVKPRESLDVKISAENLEQLMVKWLQYLIACVDTEEKFFSKFDIKEIDEKSLKARISGERIKPETGLTVVKAVTYYKLKLEKQESHYLARVSLDI